MKFISKSLKVAALSVLLSTTCIATANAQNESEREQIITITKHVCETEAKNRYGENSIKSIGKKVKWSNGYKGAMVKMKIKPKAKRSQKYKCVVGKEKSALFVRA